MKEKMSYQCQNEKKAKSVRNALRAAKQIMTFDDMVAKFGVNRKELCQIINDDNYEPPAHIWVKLGVPVYELAPVCPVHGKACVLDCTKYKAVPRANGKPRNRPPRIEIALSDPDKARARLEAALAKAHNDNGNVK